MWGVRTSIKAAHATRKTCDWSPDFKLLASGFGVAFSHLHQGYVTPLVCLMFGKHNTVRPEILDNGWRKGWLHLVNVPNSDALSFGRSTYPLLHRYWSELLARGAFSLGYLRVFNISFDIKRACVHVCTTVPSRWCVCIPGELETELKGGGNIKQSPVITLSRRDTSSL